MRLIPGYNLSWNNPRSASPRENMFIMRQNGFLLYTKIVQGTLLNPKRQLCHLYWSMVCPFNSHFAKALCTGMTRGYGSTMKDGGEKWGQEATRAGLPPLTKAFTRPFLIGLSVQELRKTLSTGMEHCQVFLRSREMPKRVQIPSSTSSLLERVSLSHS